MSLPITYEVKIDWESTDWNVTADFSDSIDDISSDVQQITAIRGKVNEQGNSPAATLELQLTPGLVSKYSPYNSGSTLYPYVRLWLPTRIKATHNSIEYPIFYGFISQISINPHPEAQSVYIYVTDGMDLLARQLVSQDYSNRTNMSDGSAVGTVLDAAGWDATKRLLENGGDNLLNYPAVGVY